ncbi:DUF3800 domain-containing protein [Rhodococcoides fascians]|uniref:DUF3800 domain-containing protein n=1 Tax=Rhodococcoides fascians TaxID=1828 RepID=UPI0009B908A9|nr:MULTISPECIES: DUF3800 domain-containing protein [Rhodococcus]OZF00602.1 DUF3800 domain-containing protein [Rhodococcus sp. 15-1189-1-1a]OZF14484.1 DUF3800 domain-containing protein [Rhodococcus sp. 14-2686-1-2]
MAYIDETGDTGLIEKGGTNCYALGCVLIDDAQWPAAFDNLLAFRKRLSSSYRINQRWELKANYLIRGGGPLKQLALAPAVRQLVYRGHMRIIHELNARAFTVVVDKAATGLSGQDCFHMAWETMMNRLERTSTKERATLMVIHDEGEDHAVRREFRKARRYLTAGSAYGTGQIQSKGTLFLEDPVSRASHSSHFIQIADMVAYAGWRTHMPPSEKVALVCPADMWSNIGDGTHRVVNSVTRRGAPGVVLRN